MERRSFLRLGLATSVGVLTAKAFSLNPAFAADAAKKIADKDVMKDGQPATIANYCSNPDKQPNKACPDWKTKPGHCETCQFFNKDNSLADYKGGKVAHCQLLTDPTKAQFVSSKGWCSTYVAKT
jgi:hypothetical protein